MKIRRFLLLVVGGLSLTSSAYATPVSSPQISARVSSQCAPPGSLLDYYDRLPAKHFAGFGGANRRSLLKRKGAVVDYKRKFIAIPCHPEGNGAIQMLQVSVFPNKKEPWIAVSRIVWAQDRLPGTLNFYYGYNDAGGLREAAPNFFPYKLKKRAGKFFENAYLPREGLTIKIGAEDYIGPKFTYSPNASVGQSFFLRTD